MEPNTQEPLLTEKQISKAAVAEKSMTAPVGHQCEIEGCVNEARSQCNFAGPSCKRYVCYDHRFLPSKPIMQYGEAGHFMPFGHTG